MLENRQKKKAKRSLNTTFLLATGGTVHMSNLQNDYKL